MAPAYAPSGLGSDPTPTANPYSTASTLDEHTWWVSDRVRPGGGAGRGAPTVPEGELAKLVVLSNPAEHCRVPASYGNAHVVSNAPEVGKQNKRLFALRRGATVRGQQSVLNLLERGELVGVNGS